MFTVSLSQVAGVDTSSPAVQTTNNVHTDNMFKLPQFYALGTSLVVIASGGKLDFS